jgi:hypothetical protein
VSKLSSLLLSSQQWAMVQQLCSGQTDGFMAKVLLIWLLMSWLWFQAEKER